MVTAPRFTPSGRLAALLLLLAAPVHPLLAQRERLVIRAEQFGAAEFTRPPRTTAREDFTMEAMQVQLAHRVVRQQGSTVVLLGGQWRGVRVALPEEPTLLRGERLEDRPAPTARTLHVAVADLMLLRTVGARHTVVGVVRPGVYGESFRVEGAAFVDRIVTPRTTVGAGLSYASSFGKLLPIPVVHIVSRPSRRVLVDALLPARGDVWWMPRKGLDLGLNASLAGAQYGLADARATRVGGSDALWLANATVGPQVRWAPQGGKWQLSADGGFTVLRRAEYARDGRSVADLAPGNVPYLRAGMQRLF